MTSWFTACDSEGHGSIARRIGVVAPVSFAFSLSLSLSQSLSFSLSLPVPASLYSSLSFLMGESRAKAVERAGCLSGLAKPLRDVCVYLCMCVLEGEIQRKVARGTKRQKGDEKTEGRRRHLRPTLPALLASFSLAS